MIKTTYHITVDLYWYVRFLIELDKCGVNPALYRRDDKLHVVTTKSKKVVDVATETFIKLTSKVKIEQVNA